jgi:2-methylcitrate dehydratase PrpD
MAAAQCCGLMSAQLESMVKRMQHGFASRDGLTAAALAASGYVGIFLRRGESSKSVPIHFNSTSFNKPRQILATRRS